MFDRNKPYNDLPFLPPKNEIDNDPVILKKLVTASRSLASVNINILRLPNPFMLVNTIALQEAKTSTEIENIFTTGDELYKAISDTLREEKADPATKEVLRYREALWAGYHTLREKRIIDPDLIIKIFQQIKNTSSGIRPPQALVVIKRGQNEFKSGEIIYTPPRGQGIVEKFLDNLIEYLNDENKYPSDPLIKMCVAHFQFEAIHPFQDGNGRAGRILNLLYLTNKELLSHPFLYLSKYIIVNKDDYYYKLGAVTQQQAWKNWILFMLDAVEKTAGLTNNLINEILDQMNATYDFGKAKLKWYSKEVNEAIFSQPYIKSKTIGAVLDKSSRTTLTKYLNELTELKILRSQKDGNEVFYLNDDLIRILEG
ncbi:MAG: Fic family protein [Bacteroidales bacterium]|nr:Fic family protein [Bacteroidales bacterium]